VVRYHLDTPEEIQALCENAHALKLDHLLIQARGRADAYYRSRIAPRGETLRLQPEGFDPLSDIFSACAPIPIHAWLNVFYLWGGETPPMDPLHPGRPERPWILRDREGKSTARYSERERAWHWIEGVFADPASRAYRALMAGVAEELLARYPVRGLHLDFIRYPGPEFGQAGALGESFRKRWGVDPRLLPQPPTLEELNRWLLGPIPLSQSLLITLNLLWAEARAQEVTSMVAAIHTVAERHHVTLSAAVFPDASDAYLAKGQDWRGWAAAGLVDRLYPMTYFGDASRFAARLRRMAADKTLGSTPLWPGIGAYIKDAPEISRERTLAAGHGFPGVSFFSLGHLLETPDKLTRLLRTPFRPPFTLPALPGVPVASKRLVKGFAAVIEKAYGFRKPPVAAARLEEIAVLKLKELAQYQQEIAEASKRSGETGRPVCRYHLAGVFRYLDPMDSGARARSQHRLINQARKRLVDGEPMGEVAAELSQDSSRRFAGRLAPRYHLPGSRPAPSWAALAPGEISPVTTSANGFWVYQLLGPPESIPSSALPWEARGLVFQELLSLRLDAGPEKISSK